MKSLILSLSKDSVVRQAHHERVSAASLDLAWVDREGRACLRVQGWSRAELDELRELGAADIGRRLGVLPSELVEEGIDPRALQPMAGRFEIDSDEICFIPRFPFVAGGRYSLIATSRREPDAGVEVWKIQRPARASAGTTYVATIYPTAPELPLNQLRIYIRFSRPMSEGWANRAVSVRRADTDELLEDVFLQMDPELWDPERRRLTLLLDPARIKRGLATHEEAGYPLMQGVPVVVSVDPSFRDADGQPLGTGLERRYEVGSAVRARVDPRAWRCHFPAAESTFSLSVEFDRPLDHALLEHCLWVEDAVGAEVDGRGSVGSSELRWSFEPLSPWVAGRYALVVDPRLEDVAGNSITRVLDRDLTRAEDTPTAARRVTIDFTCA